MREKSLGRNQRARWAQRSIRRTALPQACEKAEQALEGIVDYDELLADRIRKILSRRKGVTEVRMMGGLCFMLRGHMCCGISNDNLVVRVGPDRYNEALHRPHARPMDFTGRPFRGFVFVGPKGHRREQNLEAWIRQAADFVRSLPPRSRPKP